MSCSKNHYRDIIQMSCSKSHYRGTIQMSCSKSHYRGTIHRAFIVSLLIFMLPLEALAANPDTQYYAVRNKRHDNMLKADDKELVHKVIINDDRTINDRSTNDDESGHDSREPAVEDFCAETKTAALKMDIQIANDNSSDSASDSSDLPEFFWELFRFFAGLVVIVAFLGLSSVVILGLSFFVLKMILL